MSFQVKESHKNKLVSIKEYKGTLGKASEKDIEAIAAYPELKKYLEEKTEPNADNKKKASAGIEEAK